ncbi:MAG: hypothetical protein HKM24_03840, partial [Gammaproteobacteria bacterium]|nr:hypothetical protein [Gammaproteobacteria bacterium]
MRKIFLLPGVLLAAALLVGGCPLANVKDKFPPRKPTQTVTGPPADFVLPTGTKTIDCGQSGQCQILDINGESIARIGNMMAPFSGFADPSLTYEADTHTLWMSYSWLSVKHETVDNKPVMDFVVQTHLAKSTDSGKNFEFVKQINDNTKASAAMSGQGGWMSHEVSTIVKAGDQWQLLWI